MAEKLIRKREPQGVQGVEIGARLLLMLAKAGSAMTLRDIAAACGLPQSKAHRYLVSLCRTGLVEQDGWKGRYDLGPAALTVGLAAQYRLDEVKLADQAVTQLHEATGLTVGLAVWGDHGPTVIRRREGPHAVTVSRRIGSTMSVVTTNAGRVFAAFSPGLTAPMIEAELARGAIPMHMGRPLSRTEFQDLLTVIRQQGWSMTRGDSFAGLDAVAVPIFDHEGVACMTLSVMGAHGTVDLWPGAPAFEELVRTGRDLSERLGHGAGTRAV